MTIFTDWDIIRNLLLAGRWTVLLSLVAFTGGALVTLPLLLLRLTGGRQVKRLIREIGRASCRERVCLYV